MLSQPPYDYAFDPLSYWRTISPQSATHQHVTALVGALNAAIRILLDREDDVATLDAAVGRHADSWLEVADRYRSRVRHRSKYSLATRLDVSASCAWLAAHLGCRFGFVALLRDLTDDQVRSMPGLREEVATGIPSGYAPWTHGISPRVDPMTIAPPAPPNKDDEEVVSNVTIPPPGRASILVGGLPPKPEFAGSSESRATRAILERLDSLDLVPPPDPDRVSRNLLREFPWAADAVRAIRGDLVLSRRLGAATAKLRPTLLVGPSGAGKSRLAAAAARELGVPWTTFSAGGGADSRLLTGTARGWSSASPSLPVDLVSRTRSATVAVIVEELDKAGGSAVNGYLPHALLTLLEPETARRYMDECLSVTVDISGVTWIATANRREDVDPLVRTRMRIVEVGLPRPEDFDVLLFNSLLDVGVEHKVCLQELPELDAEVVDGLRRGFVAGRLTARRLAVLVREALTVAAEAECRARQ